MSEYTEIALGIARELASEAIWHEGRCTWIGPVVERRSGRMVFVEHSIGPDLYGGTAGVGLVLAEAATLTGEDTCERTARGAARQSLASLDRIEAHVSPGLFSGQAGVSLAAVRVGLLLGDGDLVERGRAVAAGLESSATVGASDDLVAGRAGAILALLAIGAATDDGRLVEQAARFGDGIVATLERSGARAPRPEEEPGVHLEASGMAHGPSGVCCALLELWAVTGDDRFLDSADSALAMEDRFFDELGGNWTEAGGEESKPFRGAPLAMMSWCHGAPGIGLARHLAWRRTGNVRRRREATIAIRATERWTLAALQAFRGGFTLCHGIAGNAEIIRECGDAPDAGDRPADIHRDVCRWGASEFHARALPWPDCASPSLMTGRAGVARFYMRAENDELPSVLLPGPDWLLG